MLEVPTLEFADPLPPKPGLCMGTSIELQETPCQTEFSDSQCIHYPPASHPEVPHTVFSLRSKDKRGSHILAEVLLAWR